MRPDRPRTRALALAFAVAGLVSLGLQPFVELTPHFSQEALFGFHAWVGFGGALLAFLLAWCVGRAAVESEDGDA